MKSGFWWARTGYAGLVVRHTSSSRKAGIQTSCVMERKRKRTGTADDFWWEQNPSLLAWWPEAHAWKMKSEGHSAKVEERSVYSNRGGGCSITSQVHGTKRWSLLRYALSPYWPTVHWIPHIFVYAIPVTISRSVEIIYCQQAGVCLRKAYKPWDNNLCNMCFRDKTHHRTRRSALDSKAGLIWPLPFSHCYTLLQKGWAQDGRRKVQQEREKNKSTVAVIAPKNQLMHWFQCYSSFG